MKIPNWINWLLTGRSHNYGRVPLEPVAKLDRTSETVRLRNELARLRKAAGLCERHQPNGGARNCLVCGCERLSHALSRIATICEGHPEVTGYDVHCNEDEVVKQVQELRWDYMQLRARRDTLETVLGMVPTGLHEGDERGGCLCSQCAFRRAVKAVLPQ